MTFLDPIWVLLAIPLAGALWRWRPLSRPLLLLRGVGWCLLVLALTRPVLQLPARGGTVILVADRSASMPEDEAARHREALSLLAGARPGSAGSAQPFRLGVVTFGATAQVEQVPQEAPPPGFRIPRESLGRDGSDLATALETALALIPPGEPGRLLVLSDGRWNGPDPAAVAGRAALRGVPIDYRALARPTTGDLAVASVEAPAEVRPGEAFTVTAWVQSPTARTVTYRLLRGDLLLASGERTLPAGRGRLLFRDRAAAPGTLAYRLEIEDPSATAEDPQPGNNTARWLTGVRGPRPVRVVSPEAALGELLQRGGVEVAAVAPEGARWDLETLSRYSAVVLDGVPADAVGEEGLATLAAWIEGGGGFLMTGGQSSYGTGGYFRSPLEPVLPVSMELRQEHRKLAVAVVVALDRSGSMAVSVGGGRTKMDLANLAAVQVLDLLTSMDEFGLVVVDSQAHIISPLRPVDELATSRRAMLQVESRGGGIFVYEALEAASEQLLKAQAGTRHILLFADAADAEHPHTFRQLLRRARSAGMTVSVVGLGRDTDADAALLREVAELGGGRAYFTESAESLPRLFAQDTFLVARSAFLEEPTPIRATAALTGLTGRPPPPSLPRLGGYNLTYLRPGADLAVVTEDGYQAPAVASWQAGLGRVVAYTAPFTATSPAVAGDFPDGIARWGEYGAFLSSLTRWSAGAGTELVPGVLVRQRATEGGTRVELYLDPERERDPFTATPTAAVVRAAPGRLPVVEAHPLRWTGPDRLTLEVALQGEEVVTTAVDVPGAGRRALAPVRLPYPPEMRPAEPGAGLAALEGLARATGGHRVGDLGQLWDAFPRTPRPRPLSPYLALAAALVLLLEVLERRTALVSHGVARFHALARRPGKRVAPAEAGAGKRVAPPDKRVAPTASAPPDKRVAPSGAAPSRPSGESGGSVLDALEKARRRSESRTGRR